MATTRIRRQFARSAALRTLPAFAVAAVLVPTCLPPAATSIAMAAANLAPAPAKARLISEKSGVVPGTTLNLALTFDIEPEWHIYWKGLNDSGMQPSLNLDLPAGWTAGQIQWPAPVRHVAPGDIVDHVLEGKVTLILPVTVPASAKPGEVTLTGKASWLVCKSACLPGDGEFAIKVSVVAAAADVKDGSADTLARFSAARARHPKPLPADASVKVTPRGGSVTFAAPGAIAINYYPEVDTRRPSDMVSGATTESDSLAVAFDNAEASKPIRGVLEVVRPAPAAATKPAPTGTPAAPAPKADAAEAPPAGVSTWYLIDLPPASTPAPAPTKGP
jgi:DsbC/DsbD-like thiol-disulfide interchange protein